MSDPEARSSRLGDVRRVLLVAFAPVFTLVGFMPVFSLGVLTPFIARDEGLTPGMAGLLATGLFSAAAVASVQAGRFVDRFGARAGIVTMCTCSVGSWWLASIARTVPVAIAAVGVAGIALGLAIPSVTRMFFTRLEGRARGLALGIAHSGTQLGAVISGAFLPTLAVAMGWRDAVRSAILLPALVLVVAWVLVGKPGEGSASGGGRVPFARAIREVPGLARLAVFALIVNAVVNSGVMYLPSYAVTSFDLDLVTSGLTTMTMGIASIIGKVLWGASSLGRGRKGLFVFVFSSVAVLLLLVLAPWLGTWALWAGAGLFGFTATTWAVPTTQVAGLQAGTALSGTAAAAVMMAGFAGGSLGPPVFGAALDLGGFAVAWLTAMTVLASASLLLRRLLEPQSGIHGEQH